jgi:hypothetical protein
MKKEIGIDKKTFDRWRKGLKKKSVPRWPFDVYDDSKKQSPILVDDLLYEKIESCRSVTYSDDIWKIKFPKIAEDLIDLTKFKNNVVESVEKFFKYNFPLRVEIEKDIEFLAETINIDSDRFTGMYPEVFLKPSITGPVDKTVELMKLIQQWNSFELYWKGSLLKSKTSGKIINIRLTGISYNIPDKFTMGQPSSYVEKVLI